MSFLFVRFLAQLCKKTRFRFKNIHPVARKTGILFFFFCRSQLARLSLAFGLDFLAVVICEVII
jgi:hypothetical protein